MNFAPVEVINISEKKKSRFNFNLRYLIKDLPIISIIILVIIIAMAILAPEFTTIKPTSMDLNHIYNEPSNEHIYGTDEMGKDVFTRILYGTRVSICIGILSMLTSTIIGLLYGSISGYSNMKIDKAMMRFLDIMLSIPSILIMTLLQSITKNTSVVGIVIVIAVTNWMNIAKIVRGEVIEIKNKEFVLAAKVMGASFTHIFRKHFIPNCLPSIIYMATLNCANAIMTESTLSFIGLGLPLEIPTWGSMLMNAQKSIFLNKWWVSVFPGIYIVTTVFCITNIGEYLRKRNNRKFNQI